MPDLNLLHDLGDEIHPPPPWEHFGKYVILVL